MFGGRLEHQKRRYWVRAALGFQYMKKGLEPSIDDIVEQQHTDILNAVKRKHNVKTKNCGQCNIGTLKPDHERNSIDKCPLGQIRCNCQYPARKTACHNNLCSAIYDEIQKLHISNNPGPTWSNTDVKLWCSNPWAIAVCFINAKGYRIVSTASEIDCSGLLDIMANNKRLKQHFCRNGEEALVRVRGHIHTLLRSANMEMDRYAFYECIRDMRFILGAEALTGRSESEKAAKILLQEISSIESTPYFLKPELPIDYDVELPEDWPNETVLEAKVEVNTSSRLSDVYLEYWENENVYSMTKECRGRCFILSNETFSGSKRHGAEKDEQRLQMLFEQLHFNVIIRRNLTAQCMQTELEKEARHTDHNKAECFICVICSHGTETGICGTDGKTISIQTVKTCFDGTNCKALRSKPKLFFIQACQGGKKDTDRKPDILERLKAIFYKTEDDIKTDDIKTDEKANIDVDKSYPNYVPTKADVLVACATTPVNQKWSSVLHAD